MKRTCEGCRAFSLIDNWYRDGCRLGYHYKISNYKHKEHKGFTFYRYRPLEECPKPKTWKQFDHCDYKKWTKERQNELEALDKKGEEK